MFQSKKETQEFAFPFLLFLSSRNLDHMMLTHTGEFLCLYLASNPSENSVTHLKQHLTKYLGTLLFRPMDTILTITTAEDALYLSYKTWRAQAGTDSEVLFLLLALIVLEKKSNQHSYQTVKLHTYNQHLLGCTCPMVQQWYKCHGSNQTTF